MKRPAQGVLRVVGANVYYKNPAPVKAIGIAAATGAHSIGFSEGSVISQHLGGRKFYVPLIATAKQYQNPVDALDCPMLVRRNLKLRHESHTQVTDRLVPHNGIAPERTWTMAVYDAPFLGKGEKVAHLAIHGNWVEGISSTRNAVAGQYAKALPKLDALLSLAESLATVVVVTGDYNSRQSTKKSFRTIYDVLEDHRMTIKSDGLDAVAYSRRLKLDAWTTIAERRTKSDHPWVVADLRLKR